jgi:hypothetical protein
MDNTEVWQRAERGKAHSTVIEHVKRLEDAHGHIFDRFVKLEALYDPYGPGAAESGEQLAHVQENVVASNVDAITAAVSTSDIRARFMTDGADWKMQRTARHLEWYAEEVEKIFGVQKRCRGAFKESAKKGNGLIKSEIVGGKIKVSRVLVENIVVPDDQCRDGGTPREMHQYDMVDADELAAQFPKAREEILRARSNRPHWRWGNASFSIHGNRLQVLEGWLLPIGTKGDRHYKPGRHYKVIDGHTLLDEVYEEEEFPFAVIVWSERISSWYGISGAERIAGIQRALNKRNWQIEKQLDRTAVPTTYVRPVDAKIGAQTSRVGAVSTYKGDTPVTVIAQAVSPETYQSRLDLKEAANNEFGQSMMATHATKPAGVDSGVALREYKDQASQRFAMQEKAYEQLVLDVIEDVIGLCKKLGKKAPTVLRRTRFGAKRIRWRDVDMRDVKVQIAPASTLGRTPSGRIQFVIELAQAGIISTDSTRRLLQHPDLERELSLYNAALENVEHCLDEIADGGFVMPEPFMNLEMVVWRGQAEYLEWLDDGAPEDRLEDLRTFVVQAAWMLSQKGAANQNVGAEAELAPELPAGADAPPPMPGGAPEIATPAAALSPQAMMLKAG